MADNSLRPCEWERIDKEKSAESKKWVRGKVTGFFHCFSTIASGQGDIEPCAIVEDEAGFVSTVTEIQAFNFRFADREVANV